VAAESGRPGDTPPLVLVIPVRNEEANVPELLRASGTVAARTIFVDHASTDNTGKLLATAGAHVVKCEDGGGFGRAVKAGLREALPHAAGGYVAWLPGNLKSMPADAARLAAELDAQHPYGSAYVKARRTGRPTREALASAIAGIVLSAWGWGPYWEVGGTPTIVPASRVAALLDGPDGLEFETFTITTLRRSGIIMLRLPAPFGQRLHGTSHWNRGIGSRIRLLVRLLREISRTRTNTARTGTPEASLTDIDDPRP
jgi:glycosyltransferase involved in cell wall biosynthesis